jgi:phosphate transport system substrate-binding protein
MPEPRLQPRGRAGVKIGAMLVLAALALAPVHAACAAESTVHLRGTSALVPIAQKIAEAHMAKDAEATIVIRTADSEPGLKSLLDGTTDIAMVSGDIPAEMEKRAKALGLTLEVQAVALDAIVPVVHPTNAVSSLSMDQLAAIYSGSTTDWADLGGKEHDMAVLVLPAISGTASGWKHAVLADRIQTAKAEPLALKALKTKVAATPDAIGYMGLTAIDNTVKPVAVDGIAANTDTIRKGSYPIRRQLSLVTSSASSAAARQFVSRFLSGEAQAAIAASGLVPVQ